MMIATNTRNANNQTAAKAALWRPEPPASGDAPAKTQRSLASAIEALERGHYDEADRIATMELFNEGQNGDLWMTAGLARMGRGRERSAAAAFRMCAWLTGDETAGELAFLLGG